MSYDLRRKSLQLIGAVAAVLLLTCGSASTAAVAQTHAFDPVLSLTGDCSTSELDPVPDPGICPMPPGVPGVDHPASPLSNPRAVTTDFYGNIYVASMGPEGFPVSGTEGRIVIFDSSGRFITEIADESGPGALAVDSEGNLYVGNGFHALEETLVRYSPTPPYEPATGEISYEDPPVVIKKLEGFGGLAINPANDRLFRKQNTKIVEYKSAAEGSPTEGNEELESFGEGQLTGDSMGIAVDAAHGRIYASTWQGPDNERVVKAFDLAPPHNLLWTLKESDVPGGRIQSSFLSLAADEGSGNLFLYDGEGAKKVYEFETSNSGATYLATIEHGFQYTFLGQIGVDNGEFSPNGAALDPEGGRYLYVPSNPGGVGHSYAFGPSTECEPIVESSSFANVAEAEAELQASIEPCGLKTHYVFEYLTKQRFDEQGGTFNGAQVAGAGEIPAGTSPIDVAAAAEGLTPGTTYRFRVVAENAEGSDEGEGEFATFPAAEPFPPCPNDPLRGGASGLLPDCRAYELVTPPDTNARAPHGIGHLGEFFATREASPQGGAVSFEIEGGIIPGSEGTGSLGGDPYRSSRGEGGWTTVATGPSGTETSTLNPGSNSPDQGYSFWSTGGGSGTAVVGGKETAYIRYPDGHSALLGRGSLGTDPREEGVLISEGGGHIIFLSGSKPSLGPAIKIEPKAPPTGTAAIYDRTADEVTHVVSLLPGDVTPNAGEDASYAGASLDGKGVAFKVGTTLYLRYENQKTFEVGKGVTFAGIAEGGARIFYLEGGKLWQFDATTGVRKAFNTVGTVTPVNVSVDGSTAYFVSSSVLTSQPNPNGAKAVGGGENLYRSKEGSISFVGTVTHRDVVGESNGNENVEGLGLWTEKVGPGKLGADPSRVTPDGNALLFESRADLDGYDPEGKTEIYRYDFAAGELDCLSCNPTLAPASSSASLQSLSVNLGDPEPLTSFAYVNNLSANGRRAVFQSEEALVPADVDGLQDVYEWEAQGVGSCGRAGGCVYLISSGHSLRIDYLYAASDSGDDVFFRTSDILLPRDAEETPSIYDARVGGGFPEPVEEACEGEGCRPGVTPAPALEPPAQPALGAKDNVSSKHCPKGKRKVRRHGKVRCVKKTHKHHHKQHKKAGKNRGAGK